MRDDVRSGVLRAGHYECLLCVCVCVVCKPVSVSSVCLMFHLPFFIIHSVGENGLKRRWLLRLCACMCVACVCVESVCVCVCVESVCVCVCSGITGWAFRGRRWNRQECVFEMQRVAIAVIGHCVEEEQGVFSQHFIITHTHTHTHTASPSLSFSHTHTHTHGLLTTALLIHYYFIYLSDIKTWANSLQLWALEGCAFVWLCCIECNVGSHTHTDRHTHTQCLVVGPRDQFIYMQWKRNRGLEEGI